MNLLDVALTGLDHYLADYQDYPGLAAHRARCRGILRVYVDLYGAKDAADYEVVGVEEFLSGPILNPANQRDTSYVAAGKIDVRVRQRATNKRSIIDHKFLSQALDDYDKEHLHVDTQPLHYAFLEHLNNERIDSAIWDVIAKSGHRLTKKETVDQYEERIYSIYSEKPGDYFHRQEFPIIKPLLAEYAYELHTWTQYVDSAWRSGQHLKTPESCKLFNRPCRYHQLCSGRKDVLRELEHGSLTKIDNVHPELTLPPGIEPQRVITNSRLKTFRQCMKKHDLQYNLGIRKQGETLEEPLFLGSAIHTALEAYWRAIQASECD